MKKTLLIAINVAIILGCLILSSCGALTKKYSLAGKEVDVPLELPNRSVPHTFKDLDKRIKVVVTTKLSNSDMYDDSNLNEKLRKFMPSYTFTPSVKTFGEDAAIAYMQQMRFDISSSADYTLYIDIRELKLKWKDKQSAGVSCQLSYKLTDESGENLIPTSTAASSINLAQAEQFGIGIGRAYSEALSRIKWDRIADCLRVSKTAKQDTKAQVKGAGDTALEHTVIRWYIVSAPQGADVYWRVVSSSPDVSNTNANYLGNTPYESTESFDIRGLTYDNSGNVQVEVTCEKPGYLPQRKRFNVRQAIDQKEISAKFNLIKDED